MLVEHLCSPTRPRHVLMFLKVILPLEYKERPGSVFSAWWNISPQPHNAVVAESQHIYPKHAQEYLLSWATKVEDRALKIV